MWQIGNGVSYTPLPASDFSVVVRVFLAGNFRKGLNMVNWQIRAKRQY